jgi:hypothetical protein
LIVAPRWGRVRFEPLQEGQRISLGTVIGHLTEADEVVPLPSHVAGFFAGWLVPDGHRVSPGKAVARVSLASATT